MEKMASERSAHLESILRGDADIVDWGSARNGVVDSDGRAHATGGDTEFTDVNGDDVVDGYCVECMDQPAEVHCEQCREDYCKVCWAAQHRKSKTRAKHTSKSLRAESSGEALGDAKFDSKIGNCVDLGMDLADNVPEQLPLITSSGNDTNSIGDYNNGNSRLSSGLQATPAQSAADTFGAWISERAKYIPVRLTLPERKVLRLLDAALKVSEYTDKIDILAYTSRIKRIVAQIKEVCQILAGLVLAADYKIGQELFSDKDFQQNEEWFRHVFEIGRRHKIMNPEKMRSTYGKLIYMLQDSAVPEVQEMLQFSCIQPVKTVYRVLEEAGCLELLQDEYIAEATKEILSEGKQRRAIEQEIRRKEKAVNFLAQKYKRKTLSEEQIKQLLYSVGDNHNYLRFNRDPCDRMIRYLTTYFSSDKPESSYSLGIQSGRDGARLTHNHSKQYTYVYQSLSLWREIAHEMFMLWCLAEEDLLTPNTYHLRDTGQGLNRVQPCPRIGRAMNSVLYRTQQKLGFWVGSRVIHLGDDNVPNALMFIDKYTQMARILNPVLTTLDNIDKLYRDDKALAQYIDNTFGSTNNIKKTILADFFQHAFDGSGADNFSSAGRVLAN